MVESISSVNSLNSKRCERPQLAFKGEQAPVDMDQKPDTFEKESEVAETTEEKQGMSTGKKVVIGVGSLLALVAAGFGIKKGLDIKAANKALKEAAQAVGIEDVNLYKALKKHFGSNISACEEIPMRDILSKVDKLAEDGIVQKGDSLLIFPPKDTQDIINHKGAFPDDIISIVVRGADSKIKYKEAMISKNLDISIQDAIEAEASIEIPIA